ncbi:MAG: ATP phosphoribosyltransferase [Polyangia bacterium]
MSESESDAGIRLALPKGRMQEGVLRLLEDAGIRVSAASRGYRPAVSVAGIEAKILKPQSIVEMLAAGSRDAGFAGADWVSELGSDAVELLDTGLDPVRVVAAAPAGLPDEAGRLPRRRLVVASEYERLTRRWIEQRGIEAVFVRSYGATEVFPPEDADLIVDNAASGETLRANKLAVIDELMLSSTRLYASRAALEEPARRERLERLVVLLEAVLEARRRVMVEVNVPAELLEDVIEALPCMREPTLASLHGGLGYAVKAAVPRERLPQVIPEIKRRGGTDVVVTNLAQIVP